jgi:hypothetical protein
MAKRGARAKKKVRKRSKAAANRPKRAAASRPKARRSKARPKRATRTARPRQRAAPATPHISRVVRPRRTIEELVPTPPSSLNLDRHPSAARSGHAEIEGNRRKHAGMNAVTGGDVDVNAENAYFSGEEAPGGENPTPDQDIVDDIGKALGLQYQDDEELKSETKLSERDKHRWELDPASSEDYKDRK